MSALGIASILLGALILCTRAPLMVAPAAMLRWFDRMIRTDTRIRVLGLLVLSVGIGLVAAGRSDDGALAAFLTVLGYAMAPIGTLALLCFPGWYRAIARQLLPDPSEQQLPGWRLIGGLGTIFGALLIYWGWLAL